MEAQRKVFGVPGMAVAVVQDGRVLFAKGYGGASSGRSGSRDPRDDLQMGFHHQGLHLRPWWPFWWNRGGVRWEDRVMDHLPAFRMYDPWVTREFQVQDLMAQHSGLPPTRGICWPCWAFLGPP